LQLEPVDQGEGPEGEPRQHAHAEANQHVGLQSRGNLRRCVNRGCVADPAKATPKRLYLEHAQDDKHEGHDAEAEDALKTAADRT
jgi:hypothetical protein